MMIVTTITIAVILLLERPHLVPLQRTRDLLREAHVAVGLGPRLITANRTFLYMYRYTYMYVYVHVYIYIYIFIHTYVHTYIYVYTHTNTTCVYIYIYIYI